MVIKHLGQDPDSATTWIWILFQQNNWLYVLLTQSAIEIDLRLRNFVLLFRQVSDSPGTPEHNYLSRQILRKSYFFSF
jgi:hypothetical protein